jgi:CheY-like chemotaxis protein
MSGYKKTVAFLASNAALSAILTDTLKNEQSLRVYPFETLGALTTFIRICPLDLAILDADSISGGADAALRGLRAHPGLANRHLEMMVLTRAGPAFHGPFHESGADEVLSKPIMPQRLLRHVFARLGLELIPPGHDGIYRGPERRQRPRHLSQAETAIVRHDNVIPLFGNRPRKQGV